MNSDFRDALTSAVEWRARAEAAEAEVERLRARADAFDLDVAEAIVEAVKRTLSALAAGSPSCDCGKEEK